MNSTPQPSDAIIVGPLSKVWLAFVMHFVKAFVFLVAIYGVFSLSFGENDLDGIWGYAAIAAVIAGLSAVNATWGVRLLHQAGDDPTAAGTRAVLEQRRETANQMTQTKG